MPLRISTTYIESYRYLMQNDHATEAELVAAVQRKWQPDRWQIVAGTAWHDVLRRPHRYAFLSQSGGIWYEWRTKGYGKNPTIYQFHDEDVQLALEHIGGGGLWEIKHTKLYQAGGYSCEVVAKTDWCRGLTIQDNKTKFSQ